MLLITARSLKALSPKALSLMPALTQKKDAMAAQRLAKQALAIKFWLPVLACMGFIFYMSGVQGSDVPPLFPFQDVAYHFFVYAVLAYLFARALKNTSRDIRPLQLVFFSILFCVFYGITDELHQAFTPGRRVSGFDIFINGLGGITGSSFYQWLRSSLLRR